MQQFSIVPKIKGILFKKFVSFLLIFSMISSECMGSLKTIFEEEEMRVIKVVSSPKNDRKEEEKEDVIHEEDFVRVESFNQRLDDIVEDREFNEYLNTLSNNRLVTSLKEHVSLINGEKVVESYGKRKAAILFTLFAGAVISAIGSLTFLVGEQFPEEFAKFARFNISDEVSEGVGKYLGWSNMAVETLFYTWTISGILPSLQPEQTDKLIEPKKTGFFSRCCSKVTSWLPSLAEWGLATASAIPLTLLSLIDQENETGYFKYAVVSSIGLVTLISNKFFLSLTHGQFKKVWTWLWGQKKKENPQLDSNVLEQVKKAFSESTIRAKEKLKHLPKQEFENLVSSVKDIAHTKSDLEEMMPDDKRWVNLTNYIFKDLSFVPAKINKKAMVLVPTLAVFTALSWLGLIATVPDGVGEKWSSAPALQYTLMVLAGIPLIEIGLSMGGSFGLKLSKIGDGSYSVSENLTNRIERYSGYIPITLAGLGSFATTATLTLKQFGSVPAVTWMLLPSAVLGMDLINISSGMELWNETLVALKTRTNQDKALFIQHRNFLKTFQEKLETIPAKEVTTLVLTLDPAVQKNILQFLPSMQDKEHEEWNSILRKALKEEMDKEGI